MPHYRRCPDCDGQGYPLVMGEESCQYCAGTGRDMKSDLWSEYCRYCNGRGKLAYCRKSIHKCSRCQGHGTIEY